MTKSELAQKIREKNPQYANVDDDHIVASAIRLRPDLYNQLDDENEKASIETEYVDRYAPRFAVPQTEAQDNRSFGKKTFDFFTSSSQAFGKTLGTAVSAVSPYVNKMREETLKQQEEQYKIYMDLAKKNKDDKEKAEKYLEAARKSADTAGIDIFNDPEYQKTTKQIIGEGLGTFLEIASMGTYGKATTGMKSFQGYSNLVKPKTAGLVSNTLKTVGFNPVQQSIVPTAIKPITGVIKGGFQGLKEGAITGATQGAIYGTGFGVASGLEQDKSMKDISKEGLIGGITGTLAGGALGGLAGSVSGAISGKITANRLYKDAIMRGEQAINPTQQKALKAVEDEILNIQNSYQKLRKVANYSKDNLADSRKRIAISNVLSGTVDETGTINPDRIKKAIENYKNQTIEGVENIVGDYLEREGASISPDQLLTKLINKIDQSPFIKGKAKTSAINNLRKEVEAYTRNAENNILLTELHQAKKNTYEIIKDFATPAGYKTYQKVLGEGLKEVIEQTSKTNVKPLNQELSKFYKDIELLELLSGKKVEGGRLSKYFAQIAGNIVGGAVGGTVGGGFGMAAGTIAGGEVARKIRGRQLTKAFGKDIGTRLEKSPILKKAEEKLKLFQPKQIKNVASIQKANPQSKSLGSRNTMYSTPSTKINISINKPYNKKSILPSGKINKNIKSSEQQKMFGFAGGAFGIEFEKDENGNITGLKYNPEKALIGMGLTAGAIKGRKGMLNLKKKALEESLEALTKKFNNTSNQIVRKQLDKGMSLIKKEINKIKEQISDIQPGLSIKDVGKKPLSPKIPAFKGFKDLSTKLLEDLKGKTEISKQHILNRLNASDLNLKQVEKDLIRSHIEAIKGDKINVEQFAKEIKAELLPLKRVSADDIMNGETARYENISLPQELRGDVENYSEHIYESPIETSAGDVHFRGTSDNYFGHTRIEDMAEGELLVKKQGDWDKGIKPILKSEYPSKTRRVIEVQSDLYQKGNLEKEINAGKLPWKSGGEVPVSLLRNNGWSESQIKTAIKESNNSDKLITKRQNELIPLQQYNDPTAHFRMVREEVKQAAKDGKTKLQFPTGETAMKIEGLGQGEKTWNVFNKELDDYVTLEEAGGYDVLEIGDIITEGYEAQGAGGDFVITDILGDGKFKAVPKNNNRFPANEWEKMINRMDEEVKSLAEQFDISGKVDTNNPIYRFYEKDLGKYVKSKYNAKLVTDKQGVTWWEVDIDPKYKNLPVEAFGLGLLGIGLGASQIEE
jgi:predicted transcriptional regulator